MPRNPAVILHKLLLKLCRVDAAQRHAVIDCDGNRRAECLPEQGTSPHDAAGGERGVRYADVSSCKEQVFDIL